MSDSPHITYVTCDDWAGLYRNGRLVHEGHSIPLRVTMQAAGVLFQQIEVRQEYVEEGGRLPINLGDIPHEERVS